MYNTSVSVPPPNTKSTEDYMRMIKINPFSLQHIPNPTEEMKLTALRENGLGEEDVAIGEEDTFKDGLSVNSETSQGKPEDPGQAVRSHGR